MKTNLFYILTLFTAVMSCKKAQEIPKNQSDANTQYTQYIRTKSYSQTDPNPNDYYTFEYDNQNRITKLTEIDNDSLLYSFSVLYAKDTIKKIHNMIYGIASQYYFPDCNGRITRALINNDTILYSYNDEGFLKKIITKDDSTIYEYMDGNVSKMTQFYKIASNQTLPITYTYTSYIDKAHIMDPLEIGLLQEIFGKKSKNLIHSRTQGNQTVTYTYTFDSNGLPIKINGTIDNGDPYSAQINEFEIR
jgi:hypothetical protein